jgi:hypothetical protein
MGRGVSSVDYWQPRCAHQLLLLVVTLDTPCSEAVRSVLTTHSICQFPLHFPSRVSTCAITFQLESTTTTCGCLYNADSVKHETMVQKSIHHHFDVPNTGLQETGRQCDNTCTVSEYWEITEINIIWILEFIFCQKFTVLNNVPNKKFQINQSTAFLTHKLLFIRKAI